MFRPGSASYRPLRGFTLLECMLTLSILTLTLIICFSFTHESINRVEVTWDDLTAQEWANSLLERACAAPPLKDHEELQISWPEREPVGLQATLRAKNEQQWTSTARDSTLLMQRLSVEVVCPQSDGRPPLKLTFERLRRLKPPTATGGMP